MSKSSYPGEFDSDVEIPRVDNNITEIGGDAINSLRDAVFIIERTIGLNPQGNRPSLVDRVNRSLDDNGDIKSSALSTAGLVTLPIANIHIGNNAGIKESKLDLDHSTASLNGRITSVATDIDALQTTFNTSSGQNVNHFLGLDNRHDGYAIDLADSIRATSTVEEALHTINNAFTVHEQSTVNVHEAAGISINDEFENFSASNVQEALIRLDVTSSRTSEGHQDRLHSNGISLNDRGEQGDQGNLAITTLSPGIFQTNTSKATKIAQVMRPNVARVTSKNIDFRALIFGSSHVLRVQAGGIDRGPLDISFSAIIPSPTESPLSANEITLNQIIETINAKAHNDADHYPISAYNTNGQLTIAHNIPGEEFTIQILDNVQFSAATALGFGDVIPTTFTWSSNAHAGFAGGVQITDFVSLVKVKHSHISSPLDTLNLGLGDLADKGLTVGNEGRIIVNITNHSTTPGDNGSYYIIGFPDSQSITLNSDIQNGEFDLEIAANSTSFESTANGEIFDIFVEDAGDGYGKITKTKRVSYKPLAGVSLRSVSNGFPTSGIEWEINNNSEIQFHGNTFSGIPVSIPSSSFRGQLRVFAPDNKHSAIFEVHGLPATGRASFQVFAPNNNADRLLVGSVHHSGNFGSDELKFAVDKRLQGASVDNSTEDILAQIPLEKSLSHLRNNGVIDGFEVVDSSTDSFTVRGGRALVDGRIIEVETQTLKVNSFGVATRLLLLDKGGKYVLKNEFDAGFTFNDLIEEDSYGDNRGFVTIAEFETNGTQIDGYFVDRRLIVSKLDKRVLDIEDSLNARIDTVEASATGSMWGFTEASASNSDPDGYVAILEPAGNDGFVYIPSGLSGDMTTLSARGFSGGLNPSINTRRFEFSDQETIKTSVFKAAGMTHINVYIEATYADKSNSAPFGVSGTVDIELGMAVEVGLSNVMVYEDYAVVKTVLTGVLPSNSVVERYVVSIPMSSLEVPDNAFFDFVPRVRISNSTAVDGGSGSGVNPVITFDNVRVVTSSYSVAGNVLGQDGTSMPLASLIGEVL